MASIKRTDLLSRWGNLKKERATWIPQWRDISEVLLPRSGRYFVQDRNRGQRRDRAIIDSTATRALRTTAAGLMSGMTSPARPWFKLTTSDPTLAKDGEVKLWLAESTQRMRDVFARSNTYRALHSMYEELVAFGTAACVLLPDDNTVIHHYVLTVGEYAVACNPQGVVDTLYREFQKTVRSLVAEFGMANCSNSVQQMYLRGNLDEWVTIIHAIEPRSDRDPSKMDSKNKAWRSIYFELGAAGEDVLRESGFDSFPALVPRWATSGGDIYGNCPGMDSLGDIRQLQQEQLAKSKGIAYMVDPPLQMPSNLKNKDVDSLPGGVTFYDSTGPTSGIRTQFEVKIELQPLLLDIQDIRSRINGTFFADMFLMLANNNNPNMTATEVAERHEEKMLMLGPVLERLDNELLDPLISMTFKRMLEQGLLPEPPEAFADGVKLQVEFVSMLAQAQRAVGTNSIDRFVGNLSGVAQVKPEVLDKFDQDAWADEYSEILGVQPKLIRSTTDADKVRKQRAQAQQAAQQQEAQAQQATAVKDLSQADPQGLQDVMSMFSGYTTPEGA